MHADGDWEEQRRRHQRAPASRASEIAPGGTCPRGTGAQPAVSNERRGALSTPEPPSPLSPRTHAYCRKPERSIDPWHRQDARAGCCSVCSIHRRRKLDTPLREHPAAERCGSDPACAGCHAAPPAGRRERKQRAASRGAGDIRTVDRQSGLHPQSDRTRMERGDRRDPDNPIVEQGSYNPGEGGGTNCSGCIHRADWRRQAT